MKTTHWSRLIIIILACVSPTLKAASLSDIYKQALINDPTFKAACAAWRATKEQLSLSEAALLPTVTATSTLTRQYSHLDGSAQDALTKGYQNTADYALILSQPIFNYSNWAAIQNASASVKQATAAHSAALQDLILRTATAYFNVLEAEDILRFTRVEKTAVAAQLNESRHRYEAGLIPITNVYETEAKYASIDAQAITAQNELTNQYAKLSEIIGSNAERLAPLANDLPILEPQPSTIAAWLKTAETQNYNLLAAQYAVLAAEANVKIKSGGHLPTINLTGGYQYAYNNNARSSNTNLRSKTANAGLNIALPIYQGGIINSQVRQANEYYQQVIAIQELTHRQVLSQAKQAYLGIIDAISKMRAEKQAIISTRSALKCMEAAYRFGTRTMTDVLSIESNLYAAEKNYAHAKYKYISMLLALKQAAGTLDVSDIEVINNWLIAGEAKREKFSKQKNLTLADVKIISTTKKMHIPDQKLKTTFTVQYLKNLNPEHYLLQIAASRNESYIQFFIKTHPTKTHLFYLPSRETGGTTVYKLLIGDYVDYHAALDAKTALEKNWHLTNIWIRKISTI